MKIAKNFKKVVACLLAFAVIFTCIGSALATVSAETAIVTNANGKATDVGIWYTPYNCDEFFAHRFADPDANPVGYRCLLPDGSYGIPFAGNEDIIDFYIEQMAKVGIDFVLFDCTNGGLTSKVSYGWGTGADGNCWNVNYAKLFAERLSEWNDTHAWKIRYAVSVGTYKKLRGYEDILNQGTPIVEVAEYQAEGVIDLFLNDEVVGDDYYIFDGKPLLTLFDYNNYPLDDSATAAKIADSTTALGKFTVRHSATGQAGTYSWNNNSNGGSARYDAEVVTVCPGHSLAEADIVSDSRKGGQTYKDNWATVLQAEVAPRVVMISSFNDYMENTAVFVTDTSGAVASNAEETWDNPYQYWDLTRDYIEDLREKSGDSTAVSTGLENYALKATVTASHSNFDGAGPLTAINNGSLGDRSLTYSNQNTDKEAYIDFTFGSAKKVNNVNLYADNCQAADYGFKDVAVDAKVDGNWVRVAELHNLTVTNAQLVPVYFEAVTATAIRVTVDASAQENNTFASFAEIQIYNNPTVTEADYTGITAATVEGTEVSAVKSANYALAANGGVVSSNMAHNVGFGVMTKINDGNKTNGRSLGSWAGTSNSYYDVTFDGVKAINNVVVTFDPEENMAAKHVALEAEVDGAWVRVAELHDLATGKGATVNFTFATVKATAIRVRANKTGGANGTYFSLGEIEAYYSSVIYSYTGVNAPTDNAIAIDATKSINYALAANGGVVSSNMAHNVGFGKMTNINDGNKTNGRSLGSWAGTANSYYDVTFDGVKAINNVVVIFDPEENMAAKHVALEAKVDGTWIRVAEVHDLATGKGATVNFTFASVNATVIRVRANKTGGANGTYFSLGEVEAYYSSAVTSYTGVNAPTDNATAIQGSQSINYAASANGGTASSNMTIVSSSVENIIDGNFTNWGRAIGQWNASGANYFQFTFDGVKAINTVDVWVDFLENYQTKDLAVEVLLADGSWKRVAEVHLAELSWAKANYPATTNLRKFTFETEETSAVRVYGGYAGKNASYFSLGEVEIYNQLGLTTFTGIAAPTDENKIPVAPINYALGQKVTTSNTNWSLFADTYPASNLTDGVHGSGDTAACAIANYIDREASFTVHFDKAYTINKVVILLSAHEATDSHRPDEYVIDVETADGWVRVAVKAATFSSGHLNDTFYFEAIEATAVRVIGNNKATGGGNFRMNEIQACYDSAITEDLYTGVTSTLDAAYTAGKQGDVDGDSWVDAVDLAYAINWYTRARTRIDSNAAIVDTNRDGKYDIRDVLYIREILADRDFTLMS